MTNEPKSTPSPGVAKPAAPSRRKVLEAATRLFYEEGIRTVGVDRIITEASVTKTTFYKHFRSRANLIQEYIDLVCTRDRDRLDEVVADAATAREAIDALVDRVSAELLDPGYHGSALLNAAAAHPDPDHPVRATIKAHDNKQKTALEAVFANAGHADPEQAAATLTVLMWGAHAAATTGTPKEAVSAFQAALRTLRGT